MSQSNSLDSIKTQYFGLSKTIRRVLISGVLAAIYAVLDMAVIQPLMEEYSEVTKSIESVKSQSKGFAAELLNLKGTAGIDPSLSEKKQFEAAKIKLKQIESEIEETASNFVSPAEMSRFLMALTKASKKLTLVSMQNTLPDSVIVTTTKETPAPQDPKAKKNNKIAKEPIIEVIGEDKVFKHGIEIELRGNYSDIAAFLKKLEKLPWRVFWYSLNLKRETYPNSLITIELYTLSLDEDWLTL